MIRRPPEFDQADVQALEGPAPQFENGDGPETGLTLWSEINDAHKHFVIQQWMSRAWPSLAAFCHHHGLNYRSIYNVFRRQNIPSAPVVQHMHDNDLLRKASDTGASANMGWGRLVEMVADRMIQRMIQSDTHSLEELQKIANHAVGMMDRTSKATQQIAGVERPEAQFTEMTVRHGSAIIPPDIRQNLITTLAGAAEQAVRAREGTA